MTSDFGIPFSMICNCFLFEILDLQLEYHFFSTADGSKSNAKYFLEHGLWSIMIDCDVEIFPVIIVF